MAAAAELYRAAKQRLLTLTRDGLPPEIPPRLVAQPAYEWLLEGGRADA